MVALTAAAVQGLPPGCSARRGCSAPAGVQLAVLALREARIGVMAAIIAALGTALSEVGAIVIVGGNIYGYDQTLASAALYEVNAAHYADAVAIGIVLIGLILMLMGGLGLLQHQRRRHPHALPADGVTRRDADAGRGAAALRAPERAAGRA